MIDRHHLLECILWPNGDGTFRKIVNTEDRLRDLGIYDDWKLVIPIEHGAHNSMHIQFKKGTEYECSGDKNPAWKGNKAEPPGMYRRARILYKSGQITKEELQPFRDAWNEYRRQKKRK